MRIDVLLNVLMASQILQVTVNHVMLKLSTANGAVIVYINAQNVGKTGPRNTYLV